MDAKKMGDLNLGAQGDQKNQLNQVVMKDDHLMDDHLMDDHLMDD
jgi:hypothetical protein